jgi:hypothetical protein
MMLHIWPSGRRVGGDHWMAPHAATNRKEPIRHQNTASTTATLQVIHAITNAQRKLLILALPLQGPVSDCANTNEYADIAHAGIR